MGNIKNFRMTDRIENMISSLRKRKGDQSNDTKIIYEGIELCFEKESQVYNPFYRKKITDFLNDERMSLLFNSLCDILETLSYSDGYFLEDEVKYFMTAIEPDNFFHAYDDMEKINSAQYRKTYDVLISGGKYSEEDFSSLSQKILEYVEESRKVVEL